MGVEPTSRALKVRCITVLLQPIREKLVTYKDLVALLIQNLEEHLPTS